MKKIILHLIIFILSLPFLFPKNVNAIKIITDSKTKISSLEEIDDSLLIAGDDVEIRGLINGDLFCAGQDISISADIKGDVICVGQYLTITNSNIEGDVRIAGQNVSTDGYIGKNATIFGQTINHNAKTLGEVIFGAQKINLNGNIGKSVLGGAETVKIDSVISKNINIWTNNLTIDDNAVIEGTLEYHSENEAYISQGANLVIKPNHIIPEKEIKKGEKPFYSNIKPAMSLENKIKSFLVFLTLSIILAIFFGNTLTKITKYIIFQRAKTLGIGFLIFFLTPLLIISLLISIIGIPISILLLFLYILALIFSRIITAITLGIIFYENLSKRKTNSIIISSILGISISWLAFSVPYIGWILSFLSIIWGLGSIYYIFRPPKLKKK
jgi:cytoskeletal protein CcmA (bactofilin family)